MWCTVNVWCNKNELSTLDFFHSLVHVGQITHVFQPGMSALHGQFCLCNHTSRPSYVISSSSMFHYKIKAWCPDWKVCIFHTVLTLRQLRLPLGKFTVESNILKQ